MTIRSFVLRLLACPLAWSLAATATGQTPSAPVHPIVLHAAGLLDVKNGKLIKPGEILVQGDRIGEVELR